MTFSPIEDEYQDAGVERDELYQELAVDERAAEYDREDYQQELTQD